ncbi:MAG: nuclear transport factor 2 family protein [Acidiphilium sp.]|nr:nuclear transport factor 2 family protein [Acidiphilium sp.]MDD4934291.1 nuclear transport factor 2 family protein [Acidiphilium sp.]
MATKTLIDSYYAAFNAGQSRAMLDLLSADVIHDINQGAREIGRDRFAAFLDHMNISYRERLTDIVIMVSTDGSRAAAEFVVHGEYLHTDPGLPEAHGQRYVLPAGAFFEIRDGLIARVSNYYNLEDWLKQVGMTTPVSHQPHP